MWLEAFHPALVCLPLVATFPLDVGLAVKATGKDAQELPPTVCLSMRHAAICRHWPRSVFSRVRLPSSEGDQHDAFRDSYRGYYPHARSEYGGGAETPRFGTPRPPPPHPRGRQPTATPAARG